VSEPSERPATGASGIFRERAKARWPMVLLTLVSIIQALALETLWSELTDEDWIASGGAQAWVAGLQAGAVLLAILVIWVFYAQLVMRFDWVPGLRDSLAPFALGVLEFALAETIGAGWVGFWMLGFAAAFGIAHWIGQSTFARARLEPENAGFFDGARASWLVRHGPMGGSIALILVMALIVELTHGSVMSYLAGLVVLNALLLVQLAMIRHYWHRTLAV
jgi:hypothetical protein